LILDNRSSECTAFQVCAPLSHRKYARASVSEHVIVIVIIDRWREVTCDRILLLSLRVHAAGAIT
jgi:hypothetical protein